MTDSLQYAAGGLWVPPAAQAAIDDDQSAWRLVADLSGAVDILARAVCADHRHKPGERRPCPGAKQAGIDAAMRIVVPQPAEFGPPADLDDVPGWRRETGAIPRWHRQQLTAIVTEGTEDDGHIWRHLSLSHAGRVPSWDELAEAKDTFLGAGHYAYQVCPPRCRWVNMNDRVLHLWACHAGPDGGRQLPDFTRGTGSV